MTWVCGSISLFISQKNLGDSAPTERPVSPEKQYRAAVLKNRFADTILRAREKTLNQVGYRVRLLVYLPCLYVSILQVFSTLDMIRCNLIWLRSG